jgi:hypothetical protein
MSTGRASARPVIRATFSSHPCRQATKPSDTDRIPPARPAAFAPRQTISALPSASPDDIVGSASRAIA